MGGLKSPYEGVAMYSWGKFMVFILYIAENVPLSKNKLKPEITRSFTIACLEIYVLEVLRPTRHYVGGQQSPSYLKSLI